jgi:hypothetical protein
VIFAELTSNVSNWKPNQELDSDLFDISPSIKVKVVASNTIALSERKVRPKYYVFYFSELARFLKKIPNELQSLILL